MADEVLQQGVRGITDLMVMPGLINLDFADVRSVMGEMGKAMMGTGEAEGENRAIEAAEKAISNPLLDGVSMRGAKGVIISITGGEDMRLMEVDEAASHIKELVDPDANIIWGSAFNNSLDGKIRVSVVATGIEADAAALPEPARVFAFPTARKSEEIIRTPEPVISAAPVAKIVDEEITQLDVSQAAEPVADLIIEAPTPILVAPELDPEPLVLAEVAEAEDDPVSTSSDDADDELVLGASSVIDEPVSSNPLPPEADEVAEEAPRRRWLTSDAADDEKPAARPAAGATLFERMSNIARGAAKGEADTGAATDPLDIPRFLNRQNNQ